MDDIIIRPATRDDVQHIGQLWEKLVDFHHQLDPRLPVASAKGGELYAQRIVDRLEDSHTRTLVAVADDEIVGYVLGVIVDLVPEMFEPNVGGILADIFVDADYRTKGVGRKLVNDLMTWFKSRGVEYMEWNVAANNQVGRKFWENMEGTDLMMRMRIEL